MGQTQAVFSYAINEGNFLKKYMCVICGLIYDETLGWPEDGIQPGTKWEDVPPNWTCPNCSARKDEFEMMEID